MLLQCCSHNTQVTLRMNHWKTNIHLSLHLLISQSHKATLSRPAICISPDNTLCSQQSNSPTDNPIFRVSYLQAHTVALLTFWSHRNSVVSTLEFQQTKLLFSFSEGASLFQRSCDHFPISSALYVDLYVVPSPSDVKCFTSRCLPMAIVYKSRAWCKRSVSEIFGENLFYV